MLGNTNAKVVLGGEGGDIGNGAYLVKVVDYDGTIIDQKRLNANDVYTLPTAPTHEGLTFSSWSCTHTITNGTVTVENSNIMIGALYTTTSGKSEFVVELTQVTGLSVTIKMDGTKDWGDGTSDTNETHTYADYGTYKITCDGTSLTNSSGTIVGSSSSEENYYLKSAILVGITDIKDYTFWQIRSLETLILPNAQIFRDQSVYGCYSLKCLIIPNGVTSVGHGFLRNSYSLIELVLPKGLATLGRDCFNYMYSIRSIVVPNTMMSLTTVAFRYNYICIEYDFRSFTSVPDMGHSTTFADRSQICKIRVPTDLYNSWITATYWSGIANYIVAG